MTARLLLALTLLVGLLAGLPAGATPARGEPVSASRASLTPAPESVLRALPAQPGAPSVRDAGRKVGHARQPVDDAVAVAAVVLPAGSDADGVWLRAVGSGTGASGTSDWAAVEIEDGGTASEPFVVTGAEAVEALTVSGEPLEAELVIHSSAVTTADATASDLAWEHPRILSRRAWGANESIPEPYLRGDVTGAMLHHTAGSNTYDASEVPAILRSMQAYHMKSRGFIDLGYHVVVDRFGRAWEGRGGGVNLPIVGGHAWEVTNERIFGIALMGNHETVAPTDTALETVAQVVAWKFQLHGVDPLGSTSGSGGTDGGDTWLPALSGHRDESATSCPGHHAYTRLGDLRRRIGSLLATTAYQRFSDVPPASMFAGEIGWLAGRRVTTGWPDGTYRPLDSISREAMAAFLYRLSGSPAWTPPGTSPFSDVPEGSLFHHEITWLAATGITTGWPDGTFRPGDPVSREAMAAYLFRLYAGALPAETAGDEPAPVFSDTDATPFVDEIAWLASTGVTTGWPDGTYRPLGTVKRDAMAAFMQRAVLNLGEPTPPPTGPEPTP